MPSRPPRRGPVALRPKRGEQHRWVATVTMQLPTAGTADRWATNLSTALRGLEAYPTGTTVGLGVLGLHVYCIDCEQLYADVHGGQCHAMAREHRPATTPAGLIVPGQATHG